MWKGSDIDIICQEEAAPIVRSWLRDEGQVFCGFSTLYRRYLQGPEQSKIRHVEHYMNRDDKRFSYQAAISRGQRYKTSNPPQFPDIITSDGEAMPYKHHAHLKGTKKQTVNIDLIVLARGATAWDALSDFDLSICSASFNGSEWSIPNPVDSFARVSGLTGVASNTLAKTYITSLIEEENRDIDSIAKEMDIFNHKQRYGRGMTTKQLRIFLEIIANGNVFSSNLTRPVVFTRDETPGVGTEYPLLCVVLDVRIWLISNALDNVRRLHPNSAATWPFSYQPRDLHNFIIHTSVERYHKYLRRGITISGLPSWEEWKVLRGTSMRQLPGFSSLVRGRRWLHENVQLKRPSGNG